MNEKNTHYHTFNPNIHHTCDYEHNAKTPYHIHDFSTMIPSEPNQIENHYNENLDNIEQVLSEIGIYIRKNENEYKTLPEVISETKDKWEEISKDEVLKDKIVQSLTGYENEFMFKVMMYINEMLKNIQENSIEFATVIQSNIENRIKSQS